MYQTIGPIHMKPSLNQWDIAKHYKETKRQSSLQQSKQFAAHNSYVLACAINTHDETDVGLGRHVLVDLQPSVFAIQVNNQATQPHSSTIRTIQIRQHNRKIVYYTHITIA